MLNLSVSMRKKEATVKPKKHKTNRARVRFLAAFFAGSLTISAMAAPGWYAPPWRYRQEITVSGSLADAPLSGFPLLVRITDAGNAIFEHADSAGSDIVFTAADGTTVLSHEIELFDTSGGSEDLVAWVRIPSLASGSDTTIYMYYGCDGISPIEQGSDVWDDSYSAVWHLGEDEAGTGTTGLYRDSSGNMQHGDDLVSATGKDGKIGRGQAFDGADDYFQSPDGILDWSENWTVSAWITNSVAQWQAAVGVPSQYPFIIADYGQLNKRGMWAYELQPGGSYNYDYYDYPGVSGTDPVTDWTFITVRRDGGTATVWTNGGLALTDNGVNNSVDAGLPHIRVGGRTGRHWAGSIDEVRVSSSARSDAWITAEYRSMAAPDNFVTFGAEVMNSDLYGDWYDRHWKERHWFSISPELTTSNLNDFPLLVLLTNSAYNVFSRAQTDGDDILFTTADGSTKLSHELEAFDTTPGSELLAAWVRFPEVPAEGRTLFSMYYGNPSATNQEDATGAWDDAFSGVWHLTESAPGDSTDAIYLNSATNAYHGTDYVTASGKEGLVGDGQQFTRSNADAILTGAPLAWNAPFTVETWLRQTSTSEGEWQVAVGLTGSAYPYLISDYGKAAQQRGLFAYQTGSDPNTYSFIRYDFPGVSGNDTIAEWTHVVLQRNVNDLKIYVNGELAVTDSDIGDAIDPGARTLNIGGRSATDDGRAWDGYLDEVRLSATNRPAAWIQATYRMGAAPASYVSPAAEQTLPPSGTVFLLK